MENPSHLSHIILQMAFTLTSNGHRYCLIPPLIVQVRMFQIPNQANQLHKNKYRIHKLYYLITNSKFQLYYPKCRKNLESPKHHPQEFLVIPATLPSHVCRHICKSSIVPTLSLLLSTLLSPGFNTAPARRTKKIDRFAQRQR